MDELLSETVPFLFIPESLEKVFKLSQYIFEEAKKAYFNEEVSVQEAPDFSNTNIFKMPDKLF